MSMSHREKGHLLPFLLIRPLSSEKEACEQKELELLESLYLRWSQHKNVPEDFNAIAGKSKGRTSEDHAQTEKSFI